MPHTFSYSRADVADASADDQTNAIRAAGFEVEQHHSVAEVVSGSTPAMDRKKFKRLMDELEPGDELIVTKLDHLGRNTRDVWSTVNKIAAQGVRVYCLALSPTDLTSEAGKKTMTVIFAIAEFERDLRNESIRASLKRAKAGGLLLGRPYVLSTEQHVEIWARRAHGASLGDLAKEFGVSRAMIQRAEKRGPGVG